MANRQPTIEQNSHFTAKTKDGRDVEFETTLRFYVSPTGEVRISAPGSTTVDPGQPPSTQVQSPSTQVQPPSTSVDSKTTNINIETKPSVAVDISASPQGEDKKGFDGDPNKGRERVDQGKHSGGFKSDETIDRAFPRGPQTECPITQFIPDPCRAIDDLHKTFKSLMANFFSGRDCATSQNTETLKISDGLLVKPKVGEDDLEGNKEESEIMKNEEKFDM